MIPVLLLAVSALAGDTFEEVLDNGLRVLLIEHHANPMVASAVVVRAGVVHEPDGMNGASHFLEHLLFNGTETRTQQELYDEVDLYGAYNNATTREDHTLFTLLIQKEFADEGLAIQADMLFHSTLPEAKFTKEKGIVLEELAKDRNQPSYLASIAFRAHAWAGTPLARSVLGTPASIEGLDRDDVLAYYRARYVPENMTLLVMGDFEIAPMRAVVARTFGAAPARAAPLADAGSWPAPPSANLVQGPLDAGRMHLDLGFPVPYGPNDPELAALQLATAAVASGADAPLQIALTGGPTPRALSASLSVSARQQPWSTVAFHAVLPEGSDPDAVLAALDASLGSLAPGGAARDRLPALVEGARHDEILLRDKIHYYAMMRSAALLDPVPGAFGSSLPALSAVDAAALDRAAATLREGLGTARVSVRGPGLDEAARRWAPGPAAPPPVTAARVDTTLASGMRLSFVRNDDSDVFALHVALWPRAASEPSGQGGIVDFLHRCFLKGTAVRDEAGLSQALGALGASVKTHDAAGIPYDDHYTSPAYSFVRLEMPAARWREAVALLAEILLHPRLSDDDITAVRQEMLDLQGRATESPSSKAAALVNDLLAPGHPDTLPVLGTRASIEALDAAALRAFHASYVSGSHLVLTGTGPADPGAVEAAVAGAFAALPAGTPTAEVEPAPLTPRGLEGFESLGRDQSRISLARLVEVPDADRAALEVAVAMLSSHLAFMLREERGLAYTLGAGLGTFAGRTRIAIGMGTRPDNLDASREGLQTEMEAFRRRQHAERDLRQAANAYRGRMLMRRMSRVNLAYYDAMSILGGGSPGDQRVRLDALLTVTPRDVKRVAKRYLDPDDYAVVVVR